MGDDSYPWLAKIGDNVLPCNTHIMLTLLVSIYTCKETSDTSIMKTQNNFTQDLYLH